jgi:hypothetical protein
MEVKMMKSIISVVLSTAGLVIVVYGKTSLGLELVIFGLIFAVYNELAELRKKIGGGK